MGAGVLFLVMVDYFQVWVVFLRGAPSKGINQLRHDFFCVESRTTRVMKYRNSAREARPHDPHPVAVANIYMTNSFRVNILDDSLDQLRRGASVGKHVQHGGEPARPAPSFCRLHSQVLLYFYLDRLSGIFVF